MNSYQLSARKRTRPPLVHCLLFTRPLAKVRDNKVGEFLQAIARSADAKGVSPQNSNKYFLCLLQR
ncbi:MAG: hypothetical protein KME46_04315, partial [Brasilonema angustatum HA4187-MV1]|nr:hypothetical protein [Brasilonema angustatum HA4187-MV1]